MSATNRERAITKLMPLLNTPLLALRHPGIDEQIKEIAAARDDWRWESLSSGERLVCRVVLDIWNGSGEASCWELLARTDSTTFATVLDALRTARGV